MSHLATVKTEIRDIKAMRAACEELGLRFHENKTSFGMMEQSEVGRWQPCRKPCSHTISYPKWNAQLGCEPIMLEVGLVQTPTGYRLEFDEILQGEGGFSSWESEFEKTIGTGARKLVQLYGVHKATIEARRLGHIVTRQPGKNGAIKLVVTGQF